MKHSANYKRYMAILLCIMLLVVLVLLLAKMVVDVL